MKSSAVWINSQMSNKMAQTTEKAQNCYRVQLTLKKMPFYKNTECSTKLKLFHCYLIALAQGGNNSTFLLYTLWYCTVPQMIPNRKWSRDRKWSPKWTANDSRPQVIPKVDRKWSRKKNRNDLDSSYRTIVSMDFIIITVSQIKS